MVAKKENPLLAMQLFSKKILRIEKKKKDISKGARNKANYLNTQYEKICVLSNPFFFSISWTSLFKKHQLFMFMVPVYTLCFMIVTHKLALFFPWLTVKYFLLCFVILKDTGLSFTFHSFWPGGQLSIHHKCYFSAFIFPNKMSFLLTRYELFF